MIIEERCKCGATLRVVPSETHRDRERVEGDRQAWKEIDRWRRLHKPCLRSQGPVGVEETNG